MAALVERNGAHEKTDRHRSIVDEFQSVDRVQSFKSRQRFNISKMYGKTILREFKNSNLPNHMRPADGGAFISQS